MHTTSVNAVPTASTPARAPLRSTLAEEVRGDFPILDTRTSSGQRFVYLDSAATSQKPIQVADRLQAFYASENANVHRGVHYLSALATSQYENARAAVARFIAASSDREIVFTRNATEAVSLVASSWGDSNIHVRPLLPASSTLVLLT